MIHRQLDHRQYRLAGVFLLGLTLLNVYAVLKVVPYLRAGYQDFHVFYQAAARIRAGQANQVRDLHPVFEELLFVPFTWMSFRAAYLLWTLLNLGLMALSLGIVRKTFAQVGALPWGFLILMVTGFTPAVRAIMQGQDSVLVLFLVTLGLWLLALGDQVWAGVVLGTALFKFHIVIPLALLLAIRRPRLLAGFSCVAGALAAISAMMVGWSGLLEYVRFVLHLENHGAGGTPAAAMPNLHGVMTELVGKGNGTAANVLAMVCSLIVLGMTWWRIGRRKTSIRYAFVIAIVTGILVSYHTVIHDLTLLLPVVVLLFSASCAESRAAMWTDTGLLLLLYTAVLLGSAVWPGLNPWWWIPVLFWIGRVFGNGEEEAVAA